MALHKWSRATGACLSCKSTKLSSALGLGPQIPFPRGCPCFLINSHYFGKFWLGLARCMAGDEH
eukprot:1149802-Pelagomonas_calceolata.AAC.4